MTRFRPCRFDKVAFCCAVVSLAAACGADDSSVRLNTVGYLPDAPKRASVAAPCTTFRILRDADGIEVFSGQPAAPVQNADTNESLSTLDFSDLHTPGVYRLDVPGVGRSPAFRIAADVYDFP